MSYVHISFNPHNHLEVGIAIVFILTEREQRHRKAEELVWVTRSLGRRKPAPKTSGLRV